MRSKQAQSSDFEIYKDKGLATTGKSMFEKLYQEENAGLSLSADACAPMSQDLSALKSQLRSEG